MPKNASSMNFSLLKSDKLYSPYTFRLVYPNLNS